MNRRSFLLKTLTAAAAISTASAKKTLAQSPPAGKFKLKYAPSFGTFAEHAGKDPIDQINFAADQGFTAFFDNGLMKKSSKLQKKIADQLRKRDMTLGPFVAYADFKVKSFVTRDKDIRKMLIGKAKDAVKVHKRTGFKWALFVPGAFDPGLEPAYQTANVIDNLKACAEVCEKAGLVMVLEPLNPWTNHPGLFLTKIPQAYQICKAVNSPACKIINDLYHQQITEGNLIPNMDMAWDEIAAFHIGDNPGRKEPTTGEINYRNIFKHIYDKGYKGVLCMEHGRSRKGKQGEKAVLDAYRYCDNF